MFQQFLNLKPLESLLSCKVCSYIKKHRSWCSSILTWNIFSWYFHFDTFTFFWLVLEIMMMNIYVVLVMMVGCVVSIEIFGIDMVLNLNILTRDYFLFVTFHKTSFWRVLFMVKVNVISLGNKDAIYVEL